MSRTIDAAILATLDDPLNQPIFFAELAFDDGTLYFHTDLGSIPWGGHTWTGVGDLGSIEAIEERDDLTPTGTVLRVAAMNSTVLNEALMQNYYDRIASIYFGMRNVVSAALVSDPMQIFAGKMDQMRIVSGLNPVIELAVESEMAEFQRARMVYYSDAEQQRDHAGELGFKWLAAMVDAKILWHADEYVTFGTHDVIRKPHDQRKSGNSWFSLDPRDNPLTKFALGFHLGGGDLAGATLWWASGRGG